MKNIINLLKDRIGITLFDKARKIKVILIEIKGSDIICQNKDDKQILHYTSNGSLDGFPDGMQILEPSEDMQDWEKLTWKKGDVIATDKGRTCIFEGWTSAGDYSKFDGRFAETSSQDYEAIYNVSSHDYNKLNDSDSHNYIRKIEEYFGGVFDQKEIKLNYTFKDGDIITLLEDEKFGVAKCILIFKRCENGIIDYYAFLNTSEDSPSYHQSVAVTTKARLATDTEKSYFLSALDKDGNSWDKNKKLFISIPIPQSKKFDPKPLDLCLMRSEGGVWKLCQFGFKGRNQFNAIGGAWYDECIPYDDSTKPLLGTKGL